MKRSALSFVAAFAAIITAVSCSSNVKIPEMVYVQDNFGKWGILSTNGKEILSCRYDSIGDFELDGSCPVCIDGKYGFIDIKGNELTECKYRSVSRAYDNVWFVTDGTGKVGLSTSTGKVIVDCRYTEVRNFTGDYCLVMDGSRMWGCIDRKGKELIPCKFRSPFYFDGNGQAIVRNNEGKYGIINRSGKELVPFKYEDIDPFDGSIAKVYSRLDGTKLCGAIDRDGKDVIPCKYSFINEFDDDIAIAGMVCDGESKVGAIDISGREIIPFKYEGIYGFEKGVSIVCKEVKVMEKNYWGDMVERTYDRYGLVDKSGNEIVPCKYLDISKMEDKQMIVSASVEEKRVDYWGDEIIESQTRYGVIDNLGKEIVPCKYASLSYCDGLYVASVEIDGECKYGAIDRNGTEVVPFKYNYINDFNDGVAVANTSIVENKTDYWGDIVSEEVSKYGIIDKNGKEVLSFVYDRIYGFNECGFASIMKYVDNNYRYGVIDRSGREIIPCKYDEIRMVGESYFMVESPDDYSYGLLNKDGKELFSSNYSDFEILGDSYLMVRDKSGCVGLYRMDDAFELIPCKYHSMSSMYSGTLVVSDATGSYGLVGLDGREIIVCKYSDLERYPIDNFYIAEDASRLQGLVTENGVEILPFKFKFISHPQNGLIPVRDASGCWGFYNLKGKEIAICKYRDYLFPDEPNLSIEEDMKALYGSSNPEKEAEKLVLAHVGKIRNIVSKNLKDAPMSELDKLAKDLKIENEALGELRELLDDMDIDIDIDDYMEDIYSEFGMDSFNVLVRYYNEYIDD